MGLFGIFSGKKKKEETSKDNTPERIFFDTELGHFDHVNTPDSSPPEFGYESEIDWPDGGFDGRLGVYIDCETPDSLDASRCYEKLERLASDRERTEYKVKSLLAEHFLNSRPDLIRDRAGAAATKEELINDLKIAFISIYRSGDIVISLDTGYWFDIRGDGVDVILKDDGTAEFGYYEDDR